MLSIRATKTTMPFFSGVGCLFHGFHYNSAISLQTIMTNHLSVLVNKFIRLVKVKPVQKFFFLFVLFLCIGVTDVIASEPTDKADNGNTFSNEVYNNAAGNEAKDKTLDGAFNETQKPVTNRSEKPSKHDGESFFWFIGGVVVAILICYILSSVERMIHELRCTHTPKKSNGKPYVFLPSGEVPSIVTLKGKYGEVSVSSVFRIPTEQALRLYIGLVKTETGKNYLTRWDGVFTEEEFKKEFDK